ncbi:hypothetical protein PIB30_020094 [Stylosanthes scabra]|uniref:Uncharacterized protein n=1 Tax=Stylosanthes scabra TaxID=79078 RepID=A0ABU6W8B5_9FABA|nr:hypothetical protein [Stylosanthes scabra]
MLDHWFASFPLLHLSLHLFQLLHCLFPPSLLLPELLLYLPLSSIVALNDPQRGDPRNRTSGGRNPRGRTTRGYFPCSFTSWRWTTDRRGLPCATSPSIIRLRVRSRVSILPRWGSSLLTGGSAIKRAKRRVPRQRRQCYERNLEAYFLASPKRNLREPPLEGVGGVPTRNSDA